MEILSPGYWQEQDLELGTLAPLDEAISSTLWSTPDMLVSQDSQPWTSDETVVAGGTVVLKCQVKDHEDSSLQWSNPAQQTLYFGEKRALRDNRIQLVKSTPHELSISISNVALADEGEYTCSIFTMPVRTAKSLITVLGVVYLHTTMPPSPVPPSPPRSFFLVLSPQKYLWEKEGSVPPLKMTQESALIFPFLNKSDSGTYGCTAISNLGSYKTYYTLNVNDPSPVPSSTSTYHAIIGGIVAFIVFLLLILFIFIGHYLIRHKGTYLTHEAKGSDDAPDADTAIINAEGGQSGGDDKKEYFI
ncbi:Cell adhesion molecule 3 [Myotis brandtii]|uniref:Cell adhesion molecule 3 n=1 Tax=Myotis brandtii TaxID=109478 RepID=S7NRE1_MYOBR|nr:Cell adhesion molecule 3 [Myotis brandtii]